MKKLVFLLISVFALSFSLVAQTVLPQGMKYQAVARDADGQVLADQNINLQISLQAMGDRVSVFYTETHEVTTNSLGLFDLIIGEGKPNRGSFADVPWSGEEIWMDISIDEKGGYDFSPISTTRLLAVPYAFHAGTAGDIAQSPEEKTLAGPFWKTGGNAGVFSPFQFLGTVDTKDLVFKTNNQERMTISGTGDISMSSPLFLLNNLSVDGIATFNNTTESTTKDNGAVIVEGGVGIEKNTNIGGNVEIDGTLGVDGVSTLKNTTESTSKDNGALVVEGGVGIEKNTNIGGTLDVTGVTSLNNTTESTSKDNGSLVVEGGVGIEKNTNIGGTLDVTGVTSANNTTESTTKDNGALVVEGGAGIEKNVNIGGNLVTTGTSNLNAQVTINADLPDAAAGGDYDNYPLRVTGAGQGIAVNVEDIPGSNSGRSNNYISFFKGTSNMTGRIEGMNAFDLDPTGLTDLIFDDFLTGGFDNQNSSFNLIDIITVSTNTSNVASDSEVTGTDANDFVPTQTELDNFNSQILSNYTLDIILQTVEIIKSTIMFVGSVLSILDPEDIFSTSVDLVAMGVNLTIYITYTTLNLGVAYESGAGDYAEWLERENYQEIIQPGDVVGIIGGKISKEYENPERFMVVSTAPIVLGNMPESRELEYAYEKIAFMGQVPVKVIGEVEVGDYILPSGNSDGLGVAVAPDEMKAKDYGRIVGISWDESDGKEAFAYINTAVGINSNDMAGMIDDMQGVMNEMQLAIQEINPNYKPTMFEVNPDASPVASNMTVAPSMTQQIINQMNLPENASYEDKMLGLKNYIVESGADEYFSHFPHFLEFLENPHDEAIREQIMVEYSQALENAQVLVAAIERHHQQGK